jgi:concanavalin A-like lectin/glucanase superfamily protein
MRTVQASAAVCLALLGMCDAYAQVAWNMASLEQSVQPMEHRLNGFMPLLPASLPIPTSGGAVALQSNGTLLRYAQALAARGIALPVNIGGGQDTNAGAVATAQAVQAAGLPVHVFTYINGDQSSLPSGFGHNAATAFWPYSRGTSEWAYDGYQYWPAYPLATPTAGYDCVKGSLQVLADGGITDVSGLWTDYEDYPVHWADQKASVVQRTYFSRYYIDEYAPANDVLPSVYGSSLLTDDTMDQNNPMWRYSYDLEYALLKQSARQALTDVFGAGPVYGNFGAYFSSSAIPFSPDGSASYPPSPSPEPGIAAMPVAYADNAYLAGDFTNRNPNRVPLNRTTVDDVYWYNMLTQISTSQANDRSAGVSVPWVSYNVPDDKTRPWIDWTTLSADVYKELLRHIWLRGARGMYVFNRDSNYQAPRNSFNDLEFARSMLDEMLSFRTFLTHGAPMNFAVNSSLFGGGVEWSGMSNSRTHPTQWVVRTVSRTGSDAVVAAIRPEPGLTFSNVPAPASGATFILNDDGSMHRVDSLPAAAYLQFENNYQDSSGSGRDGVPGENPSTGTPPTMTTDVPSDSSGATSLLDGRYGLYASRTNGYSVSLSRDPGSYRNGSYIEIPDTGGAFNSSSFTVEVFVKVASGISQDSASIITKGVNAGPGGEDWAIRYRDFAGAGMVELSFIESAATGAWIRTAGTPLTPGVWHHLAMTYDGSSRQVSLYVDGVAQSFGNHDDQISATGVLNWNFVRRTGDSIVLGNFDRAIDASFDDFRFTPAVLDPLQMLTVGKLD